MCLSEGSLMSTTMHGSSRQETPAHSASVAEVLEQPQYLVGLPSSACPAGRAKVTRRTHEGRRMKRALVARAAASQAGALLCDIV